MSEKQIMEAIDSLLERAIANERERCAKVCEETEIANTTIDCCDRYGDCVDVEVDDGKTTLANAAKRIREGVEPKFLKLVEQVDPSNVPVGLHR